MKAAICHEIVMLVARTLNIILRIPKNCGAFLHQVSIVSMQCSHHNSFKSSIYTALLHRNYSEALPTPAWPKGTAFMWKKNEREKVLWKRQSSRGRPFKVEGPTTEKAQLNHETM